MSRIKTESKKKCVGAGYVGRAGETFWYWDIELVTPAELRVKCDTRYASKQSAERALRRTAERLGIVLKESGS